MRYLAYGILSDFRNALLAHTGVEIEGPHPEALHLGKVFGVAFFRPISRRHFFLFFIQFYYVFFLIV